MTRIATASFVLLLLLGLRGARAAERIALVVGNNEYQLASLRRLRNCVNDAHAMGRALRSLGFKVRTVLDASESEMDEGLSWLESQSRSADLGLFYFSGHGIQVGGTNYLIPVDLKVDAGESDVALMQVKRGAIDAGLVAEGLHRSGCRTNVLILDACRNNPLARVAGGPARGMARRGLAPMQAFPGSFIAFAADANQTASDNPGGKNGLYTEELLKHIRKPGILIEDVFKRTRRGVYSRSNQAQLPAEYSRLMRDVILVPERSESPPHGANDGGSSHVRPEVHDAPERESGSLILEHLRTRVRTNPGRPRPSLPAAGWREDPAPAVPRRPSGDATLCFVNRREYAKTVKATHKATQQVHTLKLPTLSYRNGGWHHTSGCLYDLPAGVYTVEISVTGKPEPFQVYQVKLSPGSKTQRTIDSYY